MAKDGTLILIGGHEDRCGEKAILREVSERVGAGKLVVTAVASKEPEALLAEYRAAFRELGIERIEELPLNERAEALSEEAEQVLDDATAVFFTGGDQLRITSQIGDSRVYRRVEEIYHEGGTVAGTSAGASVMSETMLVSGNGDQSLKVGYALRMSPGLGLIGDVIVDQHFAERGRISRLLAAVAENPKNLGLGIDENTAVVVSGGKSFRVVGDGAVYVLDGAGLTFSNMSEDEPDATLAAFDVKLHVLAAGYGFDLEERRPLEQEEEDEAPSS
jgi:cyanophycinase